MSLLEHFDNDVERKRAEVLAAALTMQDEDLEFKKHKLDLFKEVLPSLQVSKKHMLSEDNEKGYVPFVVNKMLSYHDDSIFYAAEMNRCYQLTNRMQYDFYFHSLRSKRRPFAPWIKPHKFEDLAAVKLYFGYSDNKAHQALKILTDEQLEKIRKATTIGE